MCSLEAAPFCCSRKLFSRVSLTLEQDKAVRKKKPSQGSEDEFEYEDETQWTDRLALRDGSAKDWNDLLSVYFDVQRSGTSRGQQLLQRALFDQKMVYMDKHVFLHRLYVGLSSQFGTVTSIHRLLGSFLPVTSYIMTRSVINTDGLDREKALADAWVRSMQESMRAAAAASDERGIPGFHWAMVYRF